MIFAISMKTTGWPSPSTTRSFYTTAGDTTGSFTYICNTEPKEGGYCTLDHKRQTGTLLVLER